MNQDSPGEQLHPATNLLREDVDLSSIGKTEQIDEPHPYNPTYDESMRYMAMSLREQTAAASIMQTNPSDDVTMDGTAGVHSGEESIGSAMDVLNDERGIMDGSEVLEVSDFHRMDEESCEERVILPAKFVPESLNGKQENTQEEVVDGSELTANLVYATMDGVVHLELEQKTPKQHHGRVRQLTEESSPCLPCTSTSDAKDMEKNAGANSQTPILYSTIDLFFYSGSASFESLTPTADVKDVS